ncbi:MAG: hypothetical protein ACREIA_16320, partial [Opitutaceae bacterium]
MPFAYLGDAAVGERLIEPMRTFGRTHGEAIGMNSFVTWQTTFDPLAAAGAMNFWKSPLSVRTTRLVDCGDHALRRAPAVARLPRHTTFRGGFPFHPSRKWKKYAVNPNSPRSAIPPRTYPHQGADFASSGNGFLFPAHSGQS